MRNFAPPSTTAFSNGCEKVEYITASVDPFDMHYCKLEVVHVKSHAIAIVCLSVLFSVGLGKPLRGQGLDDEMPIGTPDLLLYSDGSGEVRSGIDPTLDRALGLDRLGITFDADVTQFYQGVANGGREQEFFYGGHGDYVLNIDGEKLIGQEGLFLQVRGEHRFGQDVNASTGALMPASILMSLPVFDETDFVLSELTFTQFFSENFAVFLGKAAAIEGDPNQFAAGRGREQFSNLAFVANPVPLNAMPYSTLTAGFVYTADPQFNQYFKFLIRNPTDTTTTSGFDELFAEGVTLAVDGRLHTNFFGKSGHQLAGAVWTSREFNALGQDPRILFPPLGIPIERKSGSWTLFYNFDQYLVVDPCNSDRGWGLFGRAAISDGNPNPLHWFASLGVGGSSPIPRRESDSFGVGWYYLGLSDEIGPIATALLLPRDETGVELYYKAQVSEWFEVTADLQVIEPAIRRGATTAVVAGLRANIEF